jgi:hypothetical protein
MDAKNVAGAVPAEPDSTLPGSLDHENGHSGYQPLERPLERLKHDVQPWVLPKQDVVLEIDRISADLGDENRHEFALHVVGEARERFVLDVGRFENWNCHFIVQDEGAGD